MYETWEKAILATIREARGKRRKPVMLKLTQPAIDELTAHFVTLEQLTTKMRTKPAGKVNRNTVATGKYHGCTIDLCSQSPHVLCEDGAMLTIPVPGEECP